MGALGLSYEDNYPLNYKIAGMSFYRNANRVDINRQTYDILNFLGDIGGLDSILLLIGFMLMWLF